MAAAAPSADSQPWLGIPQGQPMLMDLGNESDASSTTTIGASKFGDSDLLLTLSMLSYKPPRDAGAHTYPRISSIHAYFHETTFDVGMPVPVALRHVHVRSCHTPSGMPMTLRTGEGITVLLQGTFIADAIHTFTANDARPRSELPAYYLQVAVYVPNEDEPRNELCVATTTFDLRDVWPIKAEGDREYAEGAFDLPSWEPCFRVQHNENYTNANIVCTLTPAVYAPGIATEASTYAYCRPVDVALVKAARAACKDNAILYHSGVDVYTATDALVYRHEVAHKSRHMLCPGVRIPPVQIIGHTLCHPLAMGFRSQRADDKYLFNVLHEVMCGGSTQRGMRVPNFVRERPGADSWVMHTWDKERLRWRERYASLRGNAATAATYDGWVLNQVLLAFVREYGSDSYHHAFGKKGDTVTWADRDRLIVDGEAFSTATSSWAMRGAQVAACDCEDGGLTTVQLFLFLHRLSHMDTGYAAVRRLCAVAKCYVIALVEVGTTGASYVPPSTAEAAVIAENATFMAGAHMCAVAIPRRGGCLPILFEATQGVTPYPQLPLLEGDRPTMQDELRMGDGVAQLITCHADPLAVGRTPDTYRQLLVVLLVTAGAPKSKVLSVYARHIQECTIPIHQLFGMDYANAWVQSCTTLDTMRSVEREAWRRAGMTSDTVSLTSFYGRPTCLCVYDPECMELYEKSEDGYDPDPIGRMQLDHVKIKSRHAAMMYAPRADHPLTMAELLCIPTTTALRAVLDDLAPLDVSETEESRVHLLQDFADTATVVAEPLPPLMGPGFDERFLPDAVPQNPGDGSWRHDRGYGMRDAYMAVARWEEVWSGARSATEPEGAPDKPPLHLARIFMPAARAVRLGADITVMIAALTACGTWVDWNVRASTGVESMQIEFRLGPHAVELLASMHP